jgi:hypothetical protein
LRRAGGQSGVILTGLLIIAWATTYNAAVMCGDDVTHFHGAYGNDMYWPDFSSTWIPNRVFDLYSRNLTAELFDTLYFPAHSLTGVGFFVFYKIFSATMFAVFICGVYRYLRAHLTVDGAGLGHSVLLDVTLAAAVLLVLPWTNQVRLLCYELPAFLSFVVLLELAKSFYAGFEANSEARVFVSSAGLVVLSFIVAFSLEAYAAILLVVLLIIAGVAVSHAGMRARFWPLMSPPVLINGFNLALFCGVALLITVFVATRPVDVHRDQPLGWVNMLLPIIGVVVLFGIMLGGRYFAVVTRMTRRLRIEDPAAAMLGLFVVLLAATLIVVGLISFQADQNYFDFRSYPWGGLTLVLQLMAVLVAGACLAPSDHGGFGLQLGRMFLLFMLASRLAIAVLSGQAAAVQKSDLVAAAYAQILAGADGVIQTGLSLDAIPLQERPLPTADSPGWFIRNYRGFFQKYYGVDFQGMFE